jgi:nucleotide-binding universal stress UspA family protein
VKILLPIDGSDAAKAAVEFVQSLAADNPLDVTILAVTYVPLEYSMEPWIPEWNDREQERTQVFLDQARESLDTCCRSVITARGSGSVVTNILQYAKQCEADLIVLGAKGHSAIRRVLLGSVSDSVATGASCSVLVVRPQVGKAAKPEKILVTFDKSVATREAVAELMEWHLDRDTEIDVVSVAPNPYLYVTPDFAPVPLELIPSQVLPISEALQRIASQIAERFPHTETHTSIADHVGEAIVRKAENDKADLVIVGDTGHGMLSDFLLGSTSKYVLRHAPCSVLISRHHWKSNVEKQEVKENVSAG